VKFFRLEEKSRSRPAEAFSGLGGLYAAGRWNSLGRRVVYVSQSLALASLEKLVHAHSLQALTGLVYFEVQVPDHLVEEAKHLPANWHADPAQPSSQTFGNRWLSEQRSPALLVPSAVIPIEHNCILNPLHPDFTLDWIGRPQPFHYDPRIKAVYETAVAAKRRSR